MTAEALRAALIKASALAAKDQERVGRDLDAYLDDLQALRAMIAEADKSLDAGEGEELDVDEILARIRADVG